MLIPRARGQSRRRYFSRFALLRLPRMIACVAGNARQTIEVLASSPDRGDHAAAGASGIGFVNFGIVHELKVNALRETFGEARAAAMSMPAR